MYRKFKDLIGTLYSAEIHLVRGKAVILLDDEGNEILLPKDKQISSDFYKKGENLKGVIDSVDIKGNKPTIIMSRTSPLFLERLFEQEIPEVTDGLITIQKVARIPGEKAKVAVETYDDRIDPVGACVGVNGARIRSIVRELGNENIDVINYSSNPSIFITRALAPAKIISVNINEETKHAEVLLASEEVSKAIGKGGANIRLAGQLTGYEIDVFREGAEEDIELSEFEDEIEPWIIEEFRRIGLDTAKSVLEYSIEELEKRVDLEAETIQEVLDILKEEFEN